MMMNHKTHIVLMLLMFILLILSGVAIALQQSHIDELKVASDSHDVMIDFMQKGKRFTYTDGRALFLMCGGFTADERVKGRVQGIYKEHDQTDFSEWLRTSNYIE